MNRTKMMVVALLAVSGGCMVGPDYRPPKVEVPGQFSATTQPVATQPSTQPTTEPATQPAAAPVDLKRWWETFHDPTLDRLIAQGIASNLDVRLAEARVREARAELEFNRAGLFPTLDSNAAYSRSRTSKNAFAFGGTSGGTSSGGTTSGTGTGGTGGTSGSSSQFAIATGESNLYQAGFDAGWEIDVFGGTRRAIEASVYAVESQIDARRNALVTLLSEVARNYVALRGLQHEVDIVRNNVTIQQDTLGLIRSRFVAGIATDLDVARQEAQVATTESQIPTIQTQIQQAIHRLGVLLDLGPAALEQELSRDEVPPVGPAVVPPGLPSELIRRRPDVRQAERQLAAATANIGVATAALYPKFSLTGTLGLEAIDFKKLFRSDSVFWSIGPTVSWRIFDTGQLWANVHIMDARQQEAMITFQQTVLQALSDVEDALVAYDQEQARRRSLRQAVESNRRAVTLAEQLNTAGVVDFLNVLTAEQNLYISEDQLAQSDTTVSTNLVALYKALGGGWEVPEEAAAR